MEPMQRQVSFNEAPIFQSDSQYDFTTDEDTERKSL